MSKKMMKRSLVLSALMVFVITGSAMAREVLTGNHEITGTYVANGGAVTPDRGGAIYHSNGDLVINDATFKANTATHRGAAIYANNSDITVTNTKFVDHAASNAYSVVYLQNGSEMVLNGGNVFNNGESAVHVADSNLVLKGKNEFLNCVTVPSILLTEDDGISNTISTLTFEEGSTTNFIGGVAYDIATANDRAVITVESGATVKAEGGVWSTGDFVLNGKLEIGGDSYFENISSENAVKNVAGKHVYGGCLDVSAPTTIEHCDFDGSSNNVTGAKAYGGAIWADSDLTINGGSFVNNKAISDDKAYGGAIAHQNAKLNISNTVFEKNYAKTYGNAIYASGSEVNIKDSVFKNHKNYDGNAVIYATGTAERKSNVTLEGNNTFYGNGEASLNIQEFATLTLKGNTTFDESENVNILNRGEIAFTKGSNTIFINNYKSGDLYSYSTGVVNVENGALVSAKNGVYSEGDFVLDGTLEIGSESTFKNISGSGTLKFIDVAEVTIKNNNAENLTLLASGAVNEAVGDGDNSVNIANKMVSKIDAAGNGTTWMVMEAGGVIGEREVKLKVNKEGLLEVDKIKKEKTNPKNKAMSEASASSMAITRSFMNDMNKRMGELHMANGETGVWTRMVRGETEFNGAKSQYNQYQLGYDEKLSVDKRWTVGAAVTFAEGDGNFANGSTEDDSTAFAIYGSKLNNDGTFVDLIARYARLESDIVENGTKANYGTNGYSVSAEFGKRIQKGNGLWIEPQVEVTYGNVDSAEYSINQRKVTVGDMDSLIGRVGFSIGQDIEKGNVYARASYLYDFEGEAATTFGNNAGVTRTIKEDLGGGWWEVGVGANISLSKATYIYADIEKTFGGEVDTNWQWNLGVRYSF